MSMWTRRAMWIGLVTLAAGCSPALDWRDIRPTGTALLLQFPCKPAHQQRKLLLGGATVVMTLYACDAEGHTFALGVADMGDPARVLPALEAMMTGAARNLGAAPVAGVPWQPPGATPYEASRRLSLVGRRPDGRPAKLSMAVFAHGATVFQATVLGETLGEPAVDTFFASLRAGP